MKGIERLAAIDRSTPAMARALPDVPMRETVMVRLLRVAVIGMGQCFDGVFRHLGLSEHEFHVLCLLMSEDSGEASPSELSELVGASRANMTRLLDLLSRAGHITRETDTRDARRSVVRITEKGRREATAAVDKLSVPLKRAFAGLTPTEYTQLSALLRKLVESFDRTATTGR